MAILSIIEVNIKKWFSHYDRNNLTHMLFYYISKTNFQKISLKSVNYKRTQMVKIRVFTIPFTTFSLLV